MTKLISIIFLLFIFSCQGVNSDNASNKIKSIDSFVISKPAAIKDSGIQRDTDSPYPQDSSLFCDIDTLQLKAFWNKFINGVKTKNKEVILDCLNEDFEFFLGMLVTYPKFMKDCDTGLLGKVDDFGISKLTKKNFDQYFEIIFNESFIELISAIKIDSIMKNGTNTGYSYVYGYSPSLKDFPCSHEKGIKINLFYCRGYRVSIDFCC